MADELVTRSQQRRMDVLWNLGGFGYDKRRTQRIAAKMRDVQISH